jgi:Flp pilus assembly protein TadD
MVKRGFFVLVLALLVAGGVFAEEYTIFYSGECQGSITITKDARGKITIIPNIPKETNVEDRHIFVLTHDQCPLVPEWQELLISSDTKDIVIDGNTIIDTCSGNWQKKVINGDTITTTYHWDWAISDNSYVSKRVVDGNTKTLINEDGHWSKTVIDGNTTTVMNEDGWFSKRVVNGNTTTRTWRDNISPVQKTVVDKQGNNIYIRITTASGLVTSGNAYSKKEDYDRAIADYTEALQLDPNYALAITNLAIAYANRGIAYYNKKDYDRAIADYTQAIRIEPSANRYYNRGIAYSGKKDYDRAIADYTQAIRIEPSDGRYNSRGNAYYNKKDYNRAIADYTEALRINPNHTNARTSLADARKARGY